MIFTRHSSVKMLAVCMGLVHSGLGFAMDGEKPTLESFFRVMKEQHGIELVKGAREGDTNPLVDASFPVFKNASRNHSGSCDGQDIRYVVLHYTWGSGTSSLGWFAHKDSSVSSHFCITEKEEHVPAGTVVQCVSEKDTAWHAGVSEFHGEASRLGVKGLNKSSIGIHLVNAGKKSGSFAPFDPEQLKKLGPLCLYLQEKYAIKPTHFIGHADSAFQRTTSPGPLFPWGQLHEEFSIGAWLTEAERPSVSKEEATRALNGEETERLFSLLKQYGYNLTGDLSERGDALVAFRAHFSCNQQPELCDKGRAPDVNDLLWIEGLVTKYEKAEDVPSVKKAASAEEEEKL